MTKSDFIYALKTCGCLYHNGQIYYEENELIQRFEDMEMFESERLDKALSQEPCDDTISRDAVLNAIEHEDKWLLAAKGHNVLTEIAFSGLKARVDALPSVTQKYTVFHCPKCGYQDAREL